MTTNRASANPRRLYSVGRDASLLSETGNAHSESAAVAHICGECHSLLAAAGAQIVSDEPGQVDGHDRHASSLLWRTQRSIPVSFPSAVSPEAKATPEHLLECMDTAGVDFAVVVHPEPYQDDHRYLEHCLNIGGERLKGTCLFFADRPGSVDGMAGLVERTGNRIVAARVHAYAPKRLPPFGTREMRHLWKTATDLSRAIQLHFEPRYAPGFEPLIKEFSKTTVIIDHLGRPVQGTIREHELVVRWARFRNTVMKVSAIPDQNRYPHRDVVPIIRRLTGAFGADRMIYGGGFNATATGDSYRAYRDQVAALLSHLSTADRDQILGGTAARLFRFKSG